MNEVPYIVDIMFPLDIIKARYVVFVPIEHANESEARGLLALHLADSNDYNPAAGEYFVAEPLLIKDRVAKVW